MTIENKILIVGVGNLVLGDEGVGVRVAQELTRTQLPANVKIVDCGTNFINIITHLDGIKTLIIVDAIRAGGQPGQIYRYRYEELLGKKASMRFAHQIAILDVLKLLRQLYPQFAQCDIVLIGVEPQNLEFAPNLSPEVATVIPKVIQSVIDEVKRAAKPIAKVFFEKGTSRHYKEGSQPKTEVPQIS